jgi:hypothetical protein
VWLKKEIERIVNPNQHVVTWHVQGQQSARYELESTKEWYTLSKKDAG